jgi:hypothetical protein
MLVLIIPFGLKSEKIQFIHIPHVKKKVIVHTVTIKFGVRMKQKMLQTYPTLTELKIHTLNVTLAI